MSAPLTAEQWCFACPDWKERLASGASLVPQLPLDEIEAQRAIAIFNRIRLPDVPGQPTLAEAAGDWFRDIVRAAAGSLDSETRVRRVAEIFCLVPKKNSKTTGGAAVCLVLMLLNKRPNAEGLLIGPTQEVADTAFQQVVGMIKADEYLDKRFHIRDHQKQIIDRTNGARLKIKTFDMRVLTGSKPVFVLIDELHVIAAYSYASRVIGQIRGGLLPNPESLLIFITTQSDQPPAGVFKAELEYARKVRDGKITKNVRMLPILYEFPKEMQADPAQPWADPANWPMVNPNLNLSITIDRLVADFDQAKEKGEAEIRRWASQHLNVEIGVAIGAWRASHYWAGAQVEEVLTLDALLERSSVVTIGADGGGLDDLFGLVVLGRDRETGHLLIWARAWVDEGVLELRKDIAERLRDFAADGDLVICDIGTQDVEEIADIIEQVYQAGLLPEKYGVGLDAVGVAALVNELSTRGIHNAENGGPVVAVAQGYRLNGAIKGVERKLKDGTLRHGGQPMMAWCVGNAKPVLKGSAVMIDKETAGSAKIDPLIALFNAFFLMSKNPVAAGGRSFWEDPGVGLPAARREAAVA
ncbi:MAG: terminase large subunit [Kiloniellaceae bacterium]